MAIDTEAILHVFLAETEENFVAMEQALVELEGDPTDSETLNTFFRMAHTLKGNAAAFGYDSLSETAHALEEMLDSLRAGRHVAGSEDVSLMLEAVDTLRRMVPQATSGDSSLRPEDDELISKLRANAVPRPSMSAKGSSLVPVAAPRSLPAPVVQSAGSRRAQTLRVDIERLDHLLALTGEIGVARRRIEQMLLDLGTRAGDKVVEAHADTDRLHLELQELVTRLRMVPVGPTFGQCARVARDAAARTNKLARLLTEGDDVEADTAVIDQLRDPLTHMIRNAVDHGIESPETRRKLGKDPCGSIVLRAYHDAGALVIQVSDDGAGLHRERIRARARERGVPDVESLEDDELYRLVFAPGFSTAAQVTSLSGRGVGLDVVRGNLESLRGSVSVESEEGRGTTMTIRLPLTVAIIDGFAVGSAGETYLMPLGAVLECLEIAPEGHGSELSGLIDLRGTAVPFVRLRTLFGLGSAQPGRESVVIVQHDGRKAGIAVDQLLGESTAVMQPLGRLFDGLPGLAGATILGTGRVALILDVPTLFKHATSHKQAKARGEYHGRAH